MLERIGDVVKNSAAVKEIKVLEDHTHIPPQGFELLFRESLFGAAALGCIEGLAAIHADRAEAVDADAAGVGPLEKIDASHQRALAGAGIAHDAVYIPRLYVEGDIFHGVHRCVRCAERFVQCLNFDHFSTLSNKKTVLTSL